MKNELLLKVIMRLTENLGERDGGPWKKAKKSFNFLMDSWILSSWEII